MSATEVLTKPQQPDIAYHPDRTKWEARTKRRLETEELSKDLPPGFPKRLDSPLVWEGQDIEEKQEWILHLTQDHLAEIHGALLHFKSLSKPLGYINQSTFPLPTLHPVLREKSRELHFTRGFFVLRGLHVDEYTREENITIYVGISSHIGSIRGRQEKTPDENGNNIVLTHIRDLTPQYGNSKIGSPANTTDKQVFHTDAGDIISLFALNRSSSGGDSRLASSWRVYNELAAHRPDLIKTLSENWTVDGFDDPKRPYSERPLLYHQPATPSTPERIVIQYARRYFTGFQALPRSANIPPITEAQAEALDSLHFLAEKFNVALHFEKGDIQYVNNLSVFHARDGYTDAPGQERHLLRLWQRDPEYAWKTPEPLQERWDEVYDNIPEERQAFPLEPVLRSIGFRRT